MVAGTLGKKLVSNHGSHLLTTAAMHHVLRDSVTKSLLKTRSGEFDLESIHSVNLKDLGLSSLGCIGECLGLERLDLSFNDISKLHPLAGLVSLQYINLAANRISSLEGLQTLENLQTLNLAGNLIGGIGQLTCVSGLEKLTSLRLKDRTRGLSNPVCMNRDYHVEVKQLLPRLVTLDGERVNGRGSDVYSLFHEIDKALADRTELSENNRCTETVPWVPLDYWEPSIKFERSILGDAEEQLQGLLSSCMSVTTKAGDILQELKSASSNRSNS